LNILKIIMHLLFRNIMAHVTCEGYDRNLIEDLGIDGRIILKFILNNTVDVNRIRFGS